MCLQFHACIQLLTYENSKMEHPVLMKTDKQRLMTTPCQRAFLATILMSIVDLDNDAIMMNFSLKIQAVVL